MFAKSGSGLGIVFGFLIYPCVWFPEVNRCVNFMLFVVDLLPNYMPFLLLKVC